MRTRVIGWRARTVVGVAVAALTAVAMTLPASASASVSAATGSATASSAPTPISVLHDGLSTAVSHGPFGAIGMTYADGAAQYTSVGWSIPLLAPADPQSQFRIGSNTKAFVSTVLLQLEAEGKLSLDDTVERWLPGAVDANGYEGSTITIRDLLDMTSNIPEYLSTSVLTVSLPYVLDVAPYRQWTPQQLVDVALTQPPTSTNPPGTTYFYSNTNYILAGMVIQAVTGRSASAEIQQRILQPLGLTRTFFPVSDPALGGNYLHGYSFVRDVSYSNVTVPGAAGAMVSTLSDLAAFNRALFTGALLPPAQMAELEALVPTGTPGAGFGLGVSHVTTACGPAWFYNGEVLGYFSSIVTSPDATRQVVAASNEANLIYPSQGITDQMNAVLAAYCTTP
jgi:D-alanyl-D-alanine carboxypeptidase